MATTSERISDGQWAQFVALQKDAKKTVKNFEYLKVRAEMSVDRWKNRGDVSEHIVKEKGEFYEKLLQSLSLSQNKLKEGASQLDDLRKKYDSTNPTYKALTDIKSDLDAAISRMESRSVITMESRSDKVRKAVVSVQNFSSYIPNAVAATKKAFSDYWWGPSQVAESAKLPSHDVDSSDDDDGSEIESSTSKKESNEEKSARSSNLSVANTSFSSSMTEVSTNASSSSSLSSSSVASSSSSLTTEVTAKATETTPVALSPSSTLTASKRSLSLPSMAELSSPSSAAKSSLILSKTSGASSSSSSTTEGAVKTTEAEEDGATILANRLKKLRVQETDDSKGKTHRTLSADSAKTTLCDDKPLSTTSGAARKRRRAVKAGSSSV